MVYRAFQNGGQGFQKHTIRLLQDENCLFPERYLNGVKKEKSTNHSKTSISMKKY